MPAQLDPPRPGPNPATGWTLHPGQEVRGFCLVCLPPPTLSPPVLLVWHWGGGCYHLLALGREAPQCAPPTSVSLEARPEAAFQEHPPLQQAAGKGVNPISKGSPAAWPAALGLQGKLCRRAGSALPEPLCRGRGRGRAGAPEGARPRHWSRRARRPFLSRALALCPTPALPGHFWGSASSRDPGRGWGLAPEPTRLHASPPSTTATLLSGALLGLTVTFLPERPAGPVLTEVGLPAKGLPPPSSPTC